MVYVSLWKDSMVESVGWESMCVFLRCCKVFMWMCGVNYLFAVIFIGKIFMSVEYIGYTSGIWDVRRDYKILKDLKILSMEIYSKVLLIYKMQSINNYVTLLKQVS